MPRKRSEPSSPEDDASESELFELTASWIDEALVDIDSPHLQDDEDGSSGRPDSEDDDEDDPFDLTGALLSPWNDIEEDEVRERVRNFNPKKYVAGDKIGWLLRSVNYIPDGEPDDELIAWLLYALTESLDF